MSSPVGYASAAYGAGSFGLAGLGGAVLAGPALAAGPVLAAAPVAAVAAAPAVVPAAVQSRHMVSTIDVPSGGLIAPTTIDVGASQAPINMIFRSASSALSVQGVHQSAPGSVQESVSQDEPHLLRHTVTKPVIQEVNEIITPSRRITQQVQPVQEEIQTVVARGSGTAVASGALVGGGAGLVAAGPAIAGGALVGAGPALVSAGPAIATGGAIVGGPAIATGGLIGGGYGYSAGIGHGALIGKTYAAPALGYAKKY